MALVRPLLRSRDVLEPLQHVLAAAGLEVVRVLLVGLGGTQEHAVRLNLRHVPVLR